MNNFINYTKRAYKKKLLKFDYATLFFHINYTHVKGKVKLLKASLQILPIEFPLNKLTITITALS